MTNRIVFHACGGAGITQTQLIAPTLAQLGDGYANVTDYYLDTTDKNIQHLKINPDKAFIFKDDSFQAKDVDGSAGERRTNVEVIEAGIAAYMDKRGYSEPSSDEFHVVVFSAGGGSGSVIGPYLVREMLANDMNVLVIATGDRASAHLLRNSVYTLMTLQQFAQRAGKPINLFYKDNADAQGKTYNERCQTVDKSILSFMTVFSMFVSGNNYSLDNQDMKAFLNYSLLPSLQLQPALVEVGVSSGNIKPKTLEENSRTVLCVRSLSSQDVSPTHGLDSVMHWKSGQVTSQAVLASQESNFPLHMYNSIGRFGKVLIPFYTKTLREQAAEIKAAQDTAQQVEEVETEIGTVITDDGMVL